MLLTEVLNAYKPYGCPVLIIVAIPPTFKKVGFLATEIVNNIVTRPRHQFISFTCIPENLPELLYPYAVAFALEASP